MQSDGTEKRKEKKYRQTKREIPTYRQRQIDKRTDGKTNRKSDNTNKE